MRYHPIDATVVHEVNPALLRARPALAGIVAGPAGGAWRERAPRPRNTAPATAGA